MVQNLGVCQAIDGVGNWGMQWHPFTPPIPSPCMQSVPTSPKAPVILQSPPETRKHSAALFSAHSQDVGVCKFVWVSVSGLCNVRFCLGLAYCDAEHGGRVQHSAAAAVTVMTPPSSGALCTYSSIRLQPSSKRMQPSSKRMQPSGSSYGTDQEGVQGQCIAWGILRDACG